MNIITGFKKRANLSSSTGSAQVKLRDEDYQDVTRGLWYQIKHWSHQRPCWGAFCVLVASVLILWGPVSLLQSPIISPSTLWAGLVVGGLLFVMGLIELFAPSHALVAGAIGVVLSLVSLIAALGGLGIGMLLGVIGSSYAVAWRPERTTGSRLVFWSVFGCSVAGVIGMMTLVMRGTLVVAAPLAGPYTSFARHVECHNIRAIPAISRVDHQTPVELSYSGYCTSSNVVITQHVLGATIKIAEATVTSRGITSETVASHTGSDTTINGTLSVVNGLQSDRAVDIENNVTSQILYSNAESATISGISFSIS